MSYITHNKDEFNRTVCKKRKQKRTGLYIQSSPSFHISFYRERRGFIFIGIAPEQVFFKCIFKYFSSILLFLHLQYQYAMLAVL